MDDDASEFLDSRQPVSEHCRIATRIENIPAKPGKSYDRQETSNGKKPDRKPDGSYRIIARYVSLGSHGSFKSELFVTCARLSPRRGTSNRSASLRGSWVCSKVSLFSI
jgi:hypothetical protein